MAKPWSRHIYNSKREIGGHMQIIMKRVEELTPYERNPRRNDEAVK